ncbi:adenylosuccinate synthetase [Fusarium acutatum]|uniref:Adenylosuccinate synthetase n=1 Tax=Fusarium acutatum TaxID=78861 RepID=A0A8H4JJR0_9HYPO|nr:adenylosuccinate synthetase [Fusarium acutatum]
MPITVILGAQWGDEGKGKLVDGQCQEAQLCARAAGGHNAGHLVRVNGVTYSPSFFSELKELEKNLTAVHDRILVSDRVNILLDLHIAVDGLEEEELGDAAIGTTRRVFEQKLRRLADGFHKRFGELLKYDIEAELARFDEYRQTLSKYVVDGVAFMRSAQESNMKIVVEGANALMLDVDYGSYPFVTSSSTTLAGIIGGLALNPKNITETVGVVKAYTTRVGAGAFKTEDTEEIGTKLQEIGREWVRPQAPWRFRASTANKSYPGNVDWPQTPMWMLDVLDTFETIKIAIAYKIDGEELDSYPADLDILNRAEVVYHEMPGWQKPTTNARTYYDLPRAAREYVEYIEKFVGVKIKYIGTGPDREAMIQRA